MSPIYNNTKALIIIIVILLITNIGVLLFFSGMCRPGGGPGMKDDGHKGGRMREKISFFLKNEVGFNEQQLKRFDSLRDEHVKVVKPMIKSINATKDSFYIHINDVALDSALLNTLSDSIAIKQKALDKKLFNHFREIRLLCTPDQMPAYDSKVQDVIRKIVSPYRKGVRPSGQEDRSLNRGSSNVSR